jgi:hypothetical protein
MEDQSKKQNSVITRIIRIAVGLPLTDLIPEVIDAARKLLSRRAPEGVYEVLDYECRLELLDGKGASATVQKREKVRYLQDYITTFQDQAWGDGEIFLNYRCAPGLAVDQYQLGHKTYKLISLRDLKRKGEEQEFRIEWQMRNGFLKPMGFWGTTISHPTKKVQVNVVFPRIRPPLLASVMESASHRTHPLGPEAWQRLPDGRWMLVWEHSNPRLNEDYNLRWDW